MDPDVVAQLPVDLETAGVADLQQAMDAGSLTAEQLVLAYLDRIARYDPLVRAVRCLAPGALDEARALDAEPPPGQSRCETTSLAVTRRWSPCFATPVR